MNDRLTLRPYRDDDWPAVCAVHDRARPDELRGSCDPRAFVPLAEDRVDAEDFRISRKVVACVGERVVGFAGVAGTYLSWLYVDPEFYGRGIGRRLLCWGIEQIGPWAWTIVLAGNERAQRLYASEGFVEVRRFEGKNAGYPCTSLRIERVVPRAERPPLPVTVRHANASDTAIWLELRCALWPEGAAEHRDEIERFLAGTPREPQAVLIAEDEARRALGLVELSVRPWAEGCATKAVAYLEGWYVVPGARGRGVGRALIAAAQAWGRAQGCTEFASDTEADNEASAAAHRALGFAEVARVRCFRKAL